METFQESVTDAERKEYWESKEVMERRNDIIAIRIILVFLLAEMRGITRRDG